MCDKSKKKLSVYSRGRKTLRTVSTTKWERPIPSLKPYWDKICDDLEQRKEHVSELSYSSSSSPDPMTDSNVIQNRGGNIFTKSNCVVEPIVKISPPTPMRMVSQRREFTIPNSLTVNEYDADHETDDNGRANSDLSDSSSPVHETGKKDTKLYDLSVCMTEMLKNSSVQTKKTCQVHKNAPPLKIFDDNLKRFLPKKNTTHAAIGNRMQPLLSSGLLDFSKLHNSKSCPFRSQPILEDRIELDISLTKNRKRLKRSKTEGSDKLKKKTSFDQFLKVPEFPYSLNSRSNSKTQTWTKKSKSQILKSNLNYMLNIPKLNDAIIDKSLMKFNDDAVGEEQVIGNLNTAESQQHFQPVQDEYNDESSFSQSREFNSSKLETVNSLKAESDEKIKECSSNENVIPKLTENFKPLSSQFINLPRLSEEINMVLDSSNSSNEEGVSEKRIGTAKLHEQPEKDFLKVPKLGAISSYPSFSKLTPGYNIEMEVNQTAKGFPGFVDSKDIESSAQQVESSRRDLLKVPKLSMMSSYPSFNSLIPESLDSDDNATPGASKSISKRLDHEVSSNILVSSNLKSTQNTSISADEKTVNYAETTRNEDFSAVINPSENERPVQRRKSLKDSVRYAYRALKFITPNKNLDFQPQSYHPFHKSGSSSRSSDSSQASKFSKFEPAIKILTYEDVGKDRPQIQSASSSSYGTVRSRLKQNASQLLGFDYIFSSSKARSDVSSTTIPSITRSTSGPTLDFQEPVFERPSDKVLNKLPKMSIFPRRKYDKCFACLHEAFEEPVKSIRRLPLATLNAVANESIQSFSESESSSISLPNVKDFIRSQSDYEDNWTDVLRSTKKSSLLDKIEWKSSRSPLRTNIDSHRSRQPPARTSEDNQSLISDSKIENSRRNLSTKDSTASNTHSKPMSLSSEHSKASSLSGHSSESEEPQVQIKQAAPTTECFVSPYAPLHWAPSLEPLKALKYRKPVSMHGRAVSITKTEDDSTSDDNANDYRSTRKETKLNNASAPKDKNQDNEDPSSKSITKVAEKANLTKQPSIIAKIISSQLSTVANLTKKQSKADLLSGDSKGEDQTISASEIVDDGHSVGGSSTRSPLPQITEQLIENGSPTNKDDNENLETDKFKENHFPVEETRSVSGEEIAGEFHENELNVEEQQDLLEETHRIYSNDRVIEILSKCVEENQTPFEMLEALNVVATSNDPFTNKETMTIPEIARSAKIAKNLIKLLIDSKKYLNPDTFSPNLEFSSSQTPLCNPRQLRRVLPTKTYNLVARILGMPENPVKKSDDQNADFIPGHKSKDPFKLRQTGNRALAADSCDMIVHPPSYRGARRSAVDEDDFEYPQQSPYALFMNKPRRKAINWRPLTERDMLGYDPEATLNMRATRVTNKICEDFCQWLRGLGGAHSEDIDEEVLRDMFQIEFTAEACRSMQVLITEIPMVPIAVALARNTPGAGELALTRRHLIRDSKAENMPKKTIGFGSMLPRGYRFVPPKNRVDKKWLQCESVPRDLETMETVWKGITHLDSVKGFLAWVKAHPGVKPPKILTEAYSKKEALVRQPSAEEAGGLIELEMDQIKSLKVADVE